jgi:hypothetical protein
MIARLVAIVAAVLIAASACGKNANAQRGAAPEERLMTAVVAADVDGVVKALAAGADPNRMVLLDGHYQAPWKIALHRLRPERPASAAIAQAMLAAHADPAVAWGEEPSKRGGYSEQVTTPVLEAQFYGDAAAVRALLAAGLDPRSGEAETALVLACENRQMDVVRALVEGGVPVNTRHAASTPLIAAIEARDVAMMTYLEEHGARENPGAAR